ncbi:muscarinic acetylcholine receptor M3-like [Mercenaria mercenaria]|uniref:muscarinic acetylcholine receptor M3-like n=1 Tax=Mercenaria mercenaria TaxID=6596 RepID=UPI00234EAFE3|nr:muscarinic acetylcholine receptor M3-like [Mercenaria mercenaria]
MNSFTYLSTVTSRVSTEQEHVPDHSKDDLAQQLNDEMTRAVLPVTFFVGIEVFAAFFGNLLVIYVFLIRYHVCNFRYFVLCLAFTDITSSLTTMPGEMVTQLYWHVYPVPEVCKIKSFFNVFTVSAEALCLLTIDVDRYMKVCRPLGWQMKPKHAKYVCGIIYVIAFILAVPVYFFWGTHANEKIYKNTTVTVTICEKDEEWLKTNHPLQYSVTVVVIISLCLVLMFVLYVFVARRLLMNKRFRTYTSEQRSSKTSSSIETSPDPIEINSTPDVSESDFSRREDRKSSNLNVQDCDRNIAGNAGRPESRESTLSGVSVDDDQDPREKRNKISTHHSNPRHSGSHDMASRVRRKTLIMFILTVVFIITTILYLTLLSFIARSILDTMSDSSKAVYFFFFRLYFIKHVIYPIIYGVFDQTSYEKF